MNSIPETQNKQKNLERLAAARMLYSRAKSVNGWQFAVSAVAVVLFSFGTNYMSGLKLYGALWGILASVTDLLLARRTRDLRQTAASIQELFDTAVLELAWDNTTGPPPKADVVLREADRYVRNHGSLSALANWYPVDVGIIPLHLGRIACQYESCNWDDKLRRTYANALLLLLIAFIVGSVVVAAITQMQTDRLVLALFAPMLPLVLFGLRQFFEQRDTAVRIERLRDSVDRLWQDAVDIKVSAAICTERSRQLQTEIFGHRRVAVPVFDWIYNRLRVRFEKEMQWSVTDLVEAAKAKGV